jgi:hypothetical protein
MLELNSCRHVQITAARSSDGTPSHGSLNQDTGNGQRHRETDRPKSLAFLVTMTLTTANALATENLAPNGQRSEARFEQSLYRAM